MKAFLKSYLFHRIIKGWDHIEAHQIAVYEARIHRRQRIERFGRI